MAPALLAPGGWRSSINTSAERVAPALGMSCHKYSYNQNDGPKMSTNECRVPAQRRGDHDEFASVS